jgi:hypothetical protein
MVEGRGDRMSRDRTGQRHVQPSSTVLEVGPVTPSSPVPNSAEGWFTVAAASGTRAITPTTQRGVAGRWVPGSPSPNPAGRPSIPPDVKEAARAHTLAAIETLARVMADESAPPAAQVTAANALLDRGWGKPMASVEAKVATVDMRQAHFEALQRLSRR